MLDTPLALLTVGALAFGGSTPARAQDLSLELDHGAAVPLSAPQSTVFGVGLAEAAAARIGLTRFLDVGATISYLWLDGDGPSNVSGTAWGYGGGFRLKRPHSAMSCGGVSPWLSVDGLYQRTGTFNRGGFDGAVGLAVPFGDAHSVYGGPFVRYTQTLQPERAGFDNRDAKILSFGVAIELGTGGGR